MDTRRQVIALVVDIVGSTKHGLQMSDPWFRCFNREFIKQIWPYFDELGLADLPVRFTGDGWLIFNADMRDLRAMMALAKILSMRFQKDIAAGMEIDISEVPGIRIAMAAAYDDRVELPNGNIEWVGDSARMAVRSSVCCAENQIIVTSSIREIIRRDFDFQTIDLSTLPEDRRPIKWEEDIQISSVGELHSYLPSHIKLANDPSEYAPYAVYLRKTGRSPAAERILYVAEAALKKKSMPDRHASTALSDRSGPSQSTPMIRQRFMKLVHAMPNREMQRELVGSMIEMNARPDVSQFNDLIHKSGAYTDGLDWFAKMTEVGVSPNVATYNILINASTDPATAENWLDRMYEAELVPDVVTFSTLIKKSRNIEAAEGWFNRMTEARVLPNAVTYSTLVSRSTDYQKAEYWFQRMVNDGISPNEYSYNALIRSAPDYSTAEGWYWRMIYEEVTPNVYSYVPLIQLSPKYRDAEGWFTRMTDGGISPNAIIYNTLMHAAPNLVTAESWYERMLAMDIEPTDVTFNTLIDRSPDLSAAEAWYAQMIKAEVAPTEVTFNTLIKSSPDTVAGGIWLARMSDAGIPPSEQTYNTLIHLATEISTAEVWFERMIEAGLSPSNITYNTVIAKTSDLSSSKTWVTRMEKAGETPDAATLVALIKSSTDLATGKMWLGRLESISPTVGAYIGLIELSPDLPVALTWFRKMVEAELPLWEVTTEPLARKISTVAEANQLTAILKDAHAYVGHRFFSEIYMRIAPQMPGQELLNWHFEKEHPKIPALSSAVRAYTSLGRVEDACRVALAFPYFDSAAELFRLHGKASATYFSRLLDEGFEPDNAAYALGVCHMENGRYLEALPALKSALSQAVQELRVTDIQERIATIERKLGSKP